METLHETIRTIRNQLRLAMNGVTATSMREKGLRYKLNFGVSYPEIKTIAQQHEPSTPLAHALWATDCRELKILATLLQPPHEFPLSEALRWIEEVPYPEIVEFLCKHLLAHLPDAEELVTTLYARTDDGRFYAIDATIKTFDVRWKREELYVADNNPCAIGCCGGVLAFATRNGLITALDAADGRTLWQYKIGNTGINAMTPISATDWLLTTLDGLLVRLTIKK